MFSGLVREIAWVKSFQGAILRLKSDYRAEIGDSIAVNGACLTVIALYNDGFSLELSQYTKEHIAIENYTHKVHIEPALRADSRLDGHFVQGHIDGVGVITRITQQGNAHIFEVSVPSSMLPCIIPQGSITIDGISLTISALYNGGFRLTIIPHTFANTLFHSYKVGRRVNIETDVITRSILHILSHQSHMRHDTTNPKPHLMADNRTWRDFDAITFTY